MTELRASGPDGRFGPAKAPRHGSAAVACPAGNARPRVGHPAGPGGRFEANLGDTLRLAEPSPGQSDDNYAPNYPVRAWHTLLAQQQSTDQNESGIKKISFLT